MLSKEKTIRISEKQNVEKNLNSFFSRPSSFSGSEKSGDTFEYNPVTETFTDSNNASIENNPLETNKTFFPLSKKQKKIAMISTPIAALIIALAILLSNTVFKNKNMPVYNPSYTSSSNSTSQFSDNNADQDTPSNSEGTAGGNTTGGNTTGGNTTGGNTTGGNTAGGNTAGGDTAGGNTTGGKSTDVTNNDPCINGHTWVAITKTVHHEEQGHNEMVEVKSASAWYRCPYCGKEFDTLSSYYSHFDSSHPTMRWMREEYVHGTIPAKYEEKWIVDKKAYDETVITGYKCSICGKAK